MMNRMRLSFVGENRSVGTRFLLSEEKSFQTLLPYSLYLKGEAGATRHFGSQQLWTLSVRIHCSLGACLPLIPLWKARMELLLVYQPGPPTILSYYKVVVNSGVISQYLRIT
jgi:hypothetical protein